MEEKMRAIAEKVARLEQLGVFSEDEMKYIRLNAYAGRSPRGSLRVCMTPENVGWLFGVSKQTVRTWCRSGKIECWRSYEGWWDIPLTSIYELKLTNKDFSEWLRMDVKKVDF